MTSFSIEMEGNCYLFKESIPQNQATVASAKYLAYVIAGSIGLCWVPVVAIRLVREY